jgi:hypothetical protein
MTAANPPVSLENERELRYFLRTSWLTDNEFNETDASVLDSFNDALIELLTKFYGSTCETRRNIDYEYICTGTNSDPCILFKHGSHSFPVIATAVKAIQANNPQCFPQALIAASNYALFLYQKGLPVEDCVVPMITLAGNGFRFCAVYLTEDTWPVMVCLTKTMNPLNGTETVNNLSKWFFRVMEFGKETMTIYNNR